MNFYQNRLDAYARFCGAMQYVIREIGRSNPDDLKVTAQEALDQLERELEESRKDLEDA